MRSRKARRNEPWRRMPRTCEAQAVDDAQAEEGQAVEVMAFKPLLMLRAAVIPAVCATATAVLWWDALRGVTMHPVAVLACYILALKGPFAYFALLAHAILARPPFWTEWIDTRRADKRETVMHLVGLALSVALIGVGVVSVMTTEEPAVIDLESALVTFAHVYVAIVAISTGALYTLWRIVLLLQHAFIRSAVGAIHGLGRIKRNGPRLVRKYRYRAKAWLNELRELDVKNSFKLDYGPEPEVERTRMRDIERLQARLQRLKEASESKSAAKGA